MIRGSAAVWLCGEQPDPCAVLCAARPVCCPALNGFRSGLSLVPLALAFLHCLQLKETALAREWGTATLHWQGFCFDAAAAIHSVSLSLPSSWCALPQWAMCRVARAGRQKTERRVEVGGCLLTFLHQAGAPLHLFLSLRLFPSDLHTHTHTHPYTHTHKHTHPHTHTYTHTHTHTFILTTDTRTHIHTHTHRGQTWVDAVPDHRDGHWLQEGVRCRIVDADDVCKAERCAQRREEEEEKEKEQLQPRAIHLLQSRTHTHSRTQRENAQAHSWIAYKGFVLKRGRGTKGGRLSVEEREELTKNLERHTHTTHTHTHIHP